MNLTPTEKERELSEVLAAEHDITSTLRTTIWEKDGKIVLTLEQKSGRFDGEHFALVFSSTMWGQFLNDLIAFESER